MLSEGLEQVEILTGQTPALAVVDRGTFVPLVFASDKTGGRPSRPSRSAREVMFL